VDTGTQRGATGTSTEILTWTGTTLNKQPAVGIAKKMTGILMVAETIDQHGNFFILVVKDVSVYNKGMSDNLISAGCLLEAGYQVNLWIPDGALADGFATATFPFYRGIITTPDNLTVIITEYTGHTWRLPKIEAISKYVPVTKSWLWRHWTLDRYLTCDSFAGLPDIFDHDDKAHMPDFFRLNVSRDACSSILSSCVETEKRP